MYQQPQRATQKYHCTGGEVIPFHKSLYNIGRIKLVTLQRQVSETQNYKGVICSITERNLIRSDVVLYVNFFVQKKK